MSTGPNADLQEWLFQEEGSGKSCFSSEGHLGSCQTEACPKTSPGRVSISHIPVGTFSFPGKRPEAALKDAMMRSGVHLAVSRLTRPFQAHDLSCSPLITLQQKIFSEGETEAWTGSMAYPRSGSQCPCVKDCIGQNCPTPSLSCLGGG